ncbi:MAG TPA: portal protein, partial [Caldisericia bacterium]|nr:portal protein [Caldisericia bacterium]
MSEVELQLVNSYNAQQQNYGVGVGGIVYTGVMWEQYLANKVARILKYREMSFFPEISDAIDMICDDAISPDSTGNILHLDFRKEIPRHIEEQITDLWDYLINEVYAFNDRGWELFRKWLIDSELYVELVLNDEGNEIIDIKVLSPLTTMPIYTDNKITGFVQSLSNVMINATDKNSQNTTINFDRDQIAYSNYGLYVEGMDVRGYLESAIRTYNQLKNLEDALVIYRLCLDGESRVRTETGWSYIKDIKVGDIVYSYKDGKTIKTKVTKIWNNRKKNTVRIRSKHNELICTDDHPILVRNNKTDTIEYIDAGKLITKTHQLINSSKEIYEEEYVKIPRIVGEEFVKLKNNDFIRNLKCDNKTKLVKKIAKEIDYSYGRIWQFLYTEGKAIPKDKGELVCEKIGISKEYLVYVNKGENNSERIDLPEYVNEDFARLFGFLIGDGFIDNKSIVFAEGENGDINIKYSNLLKKYFGTCELYTPKNRRYGNYKTCSSVGAKIFESLGYIKGAHNKRIPKWVFTAKRSIRQAFIEGLSDADGCERYTNKGTWFSTIESCNKRLVEDVKELWSSIGLCSGLIRNRSKNKKFRKSLNRFIGETESWSVTLTKLQLNDYENICSVEQFEERTVYDIEVESDEHNFIVNNITVHNCRAPERRVWNIAVGRMPKGKAEEYIKGMIQRYKKRIIYDPETGAMNSTQNIQALTEDFWFAKNESGEGTTVETIGGGMNLGELEDVNYFLKKLYKILKLPRSRWDDSAGVNYSSGKSGDILREELKFTRFVERLQKRFSYIIMSSFMTLLKIKGIDEKYIDEGMFNIKFNSSNLFKEYKEMEINESR